MALRRFTTVFTAALMMIQAVGNGAEETEADDQRLKLSTHVQQTLQQRRELIKQEAAALPGHPWAGSYYRGDGKGANAYLDLAPNGGFTFEWRGCIGPYDRNYGTVAVDGDQLRLHCELPNPPGEFRGVDTTLTIIPWGGRIYLTAPEKVAAFCSAVNNGTEPRTRIHGYHFLRDRDYLTSVTGTPTLPQRYQAYLIPGETLAAISSVDRVTTRGGYANTGHYVESRLSMIGGSDEGLLTGHKLYAYDPPGLRDLITISEVSRTTSTAVHIRHSSRGTTPTAGWVFTSGKHE